MDRRRGGARARLGGRARRQDPRRGAVEARRARPGIERMRFALGTDHDLGEFHRRFRWDPLIGPVIRRQAVGAAAAAAGAVRGARLGGVRAADRVGPRGGDPAEDRAPSRATERLRNAARAALGRVPGRPLARRARRLRPRPEALDRAGAGRARGGLGPRRPRASTSRPGGACAPSRTSATGRSRCSPWPGRAATTSCPRSTWPT